MPLNQDLIATVAESPEKFVHPFLHQRLTPGDLHKRAPERLNAGENFRNRHACPLLERVGGVTPGAAEVTVSQPYEYAGSPGVSRFTLYAVKDLVDDKFCHRLKREVAVGLKVKRRGRKINK
jgi:hypothetical protein